MQIESGIAILSIILNSEKSTHVGITFIVFEVIMKLLQIISFEA